MRILTTTLCGALLAGLLATVSSHPVYAGNTLAFQLLGTVRAWVEFASAIPETKTQERPNDPMSNATDVYIRNSGTILLDMISDYVNGGNKLELSLPQVDEIERIRDELIAIQREARETAYERARMAIRKKAVTNTTVWYTPAQKDKLASLAEDVRLLGRHIFE